MNKQKQKEKMFVAKKMKMNRGHFIILVGIWMNRYKTMYNMKYNEYYRD